MPTDRLLKDVTAETQENLYVKKMIELNIIT